MYSCSIKLQLYDLQLARDNILFMVFVLLYLLIFRSDTYKNVLNTQYTYYGITHNAFL